MRFNYSVINSFLNEWPTYVWQNDVWRLSRTGSTIYSGRIVKLPVDNLRLSKWPDSLDKECHLR